MSRSYPIISVLLLIVAVAGPAYADDKEVARQAYVEGKRLYDLADFAGALEAFKRAYLNYEEPTFLFNIAQCFRQLGNKPEAIRFYRSYVRNVSDGPVTEEARRLIANLEASAKAEAAAPSASQHAPALTASPPPPPKRPIHKQWWLWTAVGVVTAGAAVGVAVGVTSASRTTGTEFGLVTLP